MLTRLKKNSRLKPEPLAFATEWVAAWNSHDLDRILSHYTDDIVFRSRKAERLVGSSEVRGKDALRIYWAKALDLQPDLNFTVKKVFGGVDMLVIYYHNHRGEYVVESLRFDPDGLVVEASASQEV